jgi:predicted Zn-dependent protease
MCVAATAWVAVSCVSDPVTGRRTVNYYTMDQEIGLGRQVIQANTEQMKKAGVPVNRDMQRLAQLNQMVERIARVSDLPQLPYNVTLYETNIVNAAAAPGGAMMVFSGLYHPEIGMARDEDELAAVMAHEIAHVNCRHVTERLSKVLPFALAAEVGAEVADRKGREGVGTGIRAAFVVGTALWIPAYSREDEAEADRVGMMYMARAGYDPRAAPRIWKRVSDNAKGKDKTSIFAAHPSSSDRYSALMRRLPQAMEAYAKAVGGYPPDYSPPQP